MFFPQNIYQYLHICASTLKDTITGNTRPSNILKDSYSEVFNSKRLQVPERALHRAA